MIRVRNPWWIVAACVMGLMCSAGPINIWTFSVFLRPVSDDLHIHRSDLTGALLMSGIISASLAPFVGALIDRFGPRRVILTGLVLFAAVTALQSLLTASMATIFLLFAVRAVGSAGPSPPAYAFVVTRWFDHWRGLALGIALSGVGLGTAVIPPIAAFIIAHIGWRPAFVGVGIVMLIVAGLPVALLVRTPDAAEHARLPHLADGAPGLSLREALARWRFWALAVAFFLGIIVLNGTLSQIVAMLMDRGVGIETATTVLAASGIAAVIGRLLSGLCLDRFHGPYVAVAFFLLLMAGTALFGSGLPEPAPLAGAMLCGVANGAEVDLMGFLVSRYFGLKYYGRIMGTMFGIFTASTGLGPFISTKSFDLYHSYTPAFTFYEAIIVVTLVLFAFLGPYPFPALSRHAPPPRAAKAPA
jgi:MFS family permease